MASNFREGDSFGFRLNKTELRLLKRDDSRFSFGRREAERDDAKRRFERLIDKGKYRKAGRMLDEHRALTGYGRKLGLGALIHEWAKVPMRNPGESAADYRKRIAHLPRWSQQKAKTLTALLIDQLRYASVDDIDALDVERAIESHPAHAPKTMHSHAALCRSFGGWLRKHRHTAENLLEDVEAGETAPQRKRRAVTPEDVAHVMRRARERRGDDMHALCYALAWAAGLRSGDLQRLAWDMIDLEARVITFPGGETKETRGKPAEIPRSYLPAWLCDWLREHVGTGRVFAGCDVRNLAGRGLREDLEGLDLSDQPGHTFDLHAMRTGCATFLMELEVPEAAASLFTRHSAGKTARERHYLMARGAYMHKLAARLPNLRALAFGSPGEIPGDSAAFRGGAWSGLGKPARLHAPATKGNASPAKGAGEAS